MMSVNHPPIAIMIVDDHPVVRDGLVALLNTQEDFRVSGEAESGQKAIESIGNRQPDVVLLDLEMPDLDGVATLKILRERYPDLKVIVFTAFDTDERILGAVRAGAQGYLLKDVPREELFNAIRVVYAGGSLLQPVVATRVLQHMSAEGSEEADLDSLTEREMEVLTLLAHGKTNKEIANQLVITERTVKFHVSSILGKLGAGNRTEAVTLAAQAGLIEL